jgi:hypothetical protein
MVEESKPRGKFYFIPTEADGAYSDNGGQDVTEAVQLLYDFLMSTWDSGSASLSVEEARVLKPLAEAAGFGESEGFQAYIDNQIHAQETATFRKTVEPKGHVHYFGDWEGMKDGQPTQRQCKLPDCYVKTGTPEYGAWLEVMTKYNDQISGRLPHEHAFSSVGRCMWPNCKKTEERVCQ